ncbi:MAG TPA: roadblock/LC7 domain-containing protein [Gemmatimonadaceae bacterium]|nr:roadblock/LC7 domain-containing protein [Gemmatimonadaceae bacterium]
MSDEIRRLSDELARDPSSLVFLQLGEALRQRGQLDVARKVALRGLERHAHNADAHDLLARICVDADELDRAFDEWDVVLRLTPDHVGAHKGMGYVLFKQGKLEEAERHLSAAASRDAEDASIATALHMVRRMMQYTNGAKNGNGAAPPAELAAAQQRVEQEARLLFAELLGEGEHTAILLDGDGLVTAGVYMTADGNDVAQEIGAELSGVRDEAQRAIRHLELGDWRSVTFETEVATVAMAPVARDSLVLLAAGASMPLGFVRRMLDRCAQLAADWLGEGA